MKNNRIILSLAFILFILISCDNKVENVESKKSKLYEEIEIGKQVWMEKNLNVDKFRNGDKIQQAKSSSEWDSLNNLKQAAWCYYDNNPKNGEMYGKLYNWWAVNDKRGLAPLGYHIPSDEDWTILTDFLGGTEIAGSKIKSKTAWNDEGRSTNSTNFSALPGGYRSIDGIFYSVNDFGTWWSTTKFIIPDGRFTIYSRDIDYTSFVKRQIHDVSEGLSVRCLKD